MYFLVFGGGSFEVVAGWRRIRPRSLCRPFVVVRGVRLGSAVEVVLRDLGWMAWGREVIPAGPVGFASERFTQLCGIGVSYVSRGYCSRDVVVSVQCCQPGAYPHHMESAVMRFERRCKSCSHLW